MGSSTAPFDTLNWKTTPPPTTIYVACFRAMGNLKLCSMGIATRCWIQGLYAFIKRWRQFSLTACNWWQASMCRNWVLGFTWAEWINTISSFFLHTSLKPLNKDTTRSNTKAIHRLCCCLQINLVRFQKQAR